MEASIHYRATAVLTPCHNNLNHLSFEKVDLVWLNRVLVIILKKPETKMGKENHETLLFCCFV